MRVFLTQTRSIPKNDRSAYNVGTDDPSAETEAWGECDEYGRCEWLPCCEVGKKNGSWHALVLSDYKLWKGKKQIEKVNGQDVFFGWLYMPSHNDDNEIVSTEIAEELIDPFCW